MSLLLVTLGWIFGAIVLIGGLFFGAKTVMASRGTGNGGADSDGGPSGPIRGRLSVTDGPHAGETFYLVDDVTTFGSMDGNDVVIRDVGVKRHFGTALRIWQATNSRTLDRPTGFLSTIGRPRNSSSEREIQFGLVERETTFHQVNLRSVRLLTPSVCAHGGNRQSRTRSETMWKNLGCLLPVWRECWWDVEHTR